MNGLDVDNNTINRVRYNPNILTKISENVFKISQL